VTGSIFSFKGLKDQTVDALKSYEGYDYCVCDEAQSMTKQSFNILDPTIRRENSEIWFIFNPKYSDDFVYDFCINTPPPNLIGTEVNYTDNPYCPQVLVEQAERMKRVEPDLYQHVWLGKPMGQGGRIYPQYSSTIHEISDIDPDHIAKCNRYFSIDPHRSYYPAMLWGMVTPSAALVIYNEWPRYDTVNGHYSDVRDDKRLDMSVSDLADIIKANDLIDAREFPFLRTIDPHFNNDNIAQTKDQYDLTTMLSECGVTGWTKAPSELIAKQRDVLKSAIEYDPALPLAGPNMPSLYVCKRCVNLRRALERHSWDADRDREGEKYKDFIDALRYMLSIIGHPIRYYQVNKTFNELPISMSNAMLSTIPAKGYYR
jgi:hypothetical protein